MLKKLTFFVLSFAMLGSPAFAQVDVGVTEREAGEFEESAFDKAFSVGIRSGVVAFEDSTGDETSRLLNGISIDWNMADIWSPGTRLYYGIGTGVLYSHLGSPDSNFFGADTPQGAPQANANLYIVPIQLIGGYQVLEDILLAVNAGTNLIYRNNGDSMNLGRGQDDNSAELFPNLGGNIGWSVSENFALTLRGDWTFSPEDDFFTGTLGAVFPFG